MMQKGGDAAKDAGNLLADQLNGQDTEQHLRKTFDNDKYNNGLVPNQMYGGGVRRWAADYFEAWFEHIAPTLLSSILAATQEGGLTSTEGVNTLADKQQQMLDKIREQKQDTVDSWVDALTWRESRFDTIVSVLKGGVKT